MSRRKRTYAPLLPPTMASSDRSASMATPAALGAVPQPKRAKSVPCVRSPASAPTHIFAGVVAALLFRPADVRRARILQGVLQSGGAQVCEDSAAERVTHVVSLEASMAATRRLGSWRATSAVVGASWVQACRMARCRVAEHAHAVEDAVAEPPPRAHAPMPPPPRPPRAEPEQDPAPPPTPPTTVEALLATFAHAADGSDTDASDASDDDGAAVVPLVAGHGRRSFACQAGGTPSDDTRGRMHARNAMLIAEFEALQMQAAALQDVGREHGYRRIVRALRAVPFTITHEDQLRGRRGFGTRTLRKVQEMLAWGGTRARADAAQWSDKPAALAALTSVWGIGPRTAQQLYHAGMRTLDDLRAHTHLLSRGARVGLMHHADIARRVPRAEVAELGAAVRNCALLLLPMEQRGALVCTLAGSYRRGSASSGDVDVLISHPKHEPRALLTRLLARLHRDGLLVGDLQQPDEEKHWARRHERGREGGRAEAVGGDDKDPQTQAKYMGMARLRAGMHARRIDILAVPSREYPFALFYFTGNAHFNRSVRLYAKQRGWRLDRHGLRRIVRDENGRKLFKHPYHTWGKRVLCERDIFTALNLEYREPEQRNV